MSAAGTRFWAHNMQSRGTIHDLALKRNNWVQFALLPIQSRFLGPASVTLEPGVTGADART